MPPDSIAGAATDLMDEQFFIRMKGRVQGPFTPGELRERAGRQQFSRLYEISTDGDTWKCATSRPDLFPPVRQPEIPVEPRVEPVPEVEPQPSADAESVEEAPPLANQWFYTRDSLECGPADFEELIHLVRSGQVGPEEFAWTDGMEDWAGIAEIPGLAPHLVGSQPQPTGASAGRDVVAVAPANSSLAVASLVLGLLGWNLLFFVGAVLAIVFGHSALRDIRDSNGAVKGAGMAVAGLVLGYIVLIGTLVTLFGLVVIVLLSGAHPPA